jgi:phage shock protein A
MPFDDEKKIKRLKEREAKLVSKGNKAVDEGREKKADRLLGRAARVENRIINLKERDTPLPPSNF